MNEERGMMNGRQEHLGADLGADLGIDRDPLERVIC